MNFLQNKLIKVYNNFLKLYREIIEIDYKEAIEILKKNKDSILLDVRSHQEYKEYHLDNSINIPLYELSKKVDSILSDKNQIIIVYCQSGIRSKKALKVLKNLNYINIYNLKGRIRFNLMSKRLLK